MSQQKTDRFKRVHKAIDQGHNDLNGVIDESKEPGPWAREEVREALDNVEARIDKLRERTEE